MGSDLALYRRSSTRVHGPMASKTDTDGRHTPMVAATKANGVGVLAMGTESGPRLLMVIKIVIKNNNSNKTTKVLWVGHYLGTVLIKSPC